MARTGVEIHCAATIVFRPLVLVSHNHANWRAQSNPKLRAGLDLDPVLLIPRRREGALTWSPARHLRLDVVLRQGHAGRAPVHDAPDGPAVGFTIARID